MKQLAGVWMICLALCAAHIHARDTEPFADLGNTFLYPVNDARGLVMLLADSTALAALAPQYAAQLNGAGYAVAVVDIDNFLHQAALDHATCLNAVTLLDVYSQHLQDRFHFARYKRPVLLGLGNGAGLAYVLLQQTPRTLFRGAISVGFQPLLVLPAAPCSGADMAAWEPVDNNVYRLLARPTAIPWLMIATASDALQPGAQGFAKVAAQVLSDAPEAVVVAMNWFSEKTAVAASAVDDLPLVELPVPGPTHNYFAVVLSGDGGWANIDQDIGNELAARGIPVVGFNSLQYFWNRKTPDQAALDLARVITHYRTQWRLPRVLLIGFSLGADVLPFMLTRISPEQRKMIDGVALLSPSETVDFEFHVTNWLGSADSHEQSIAPELARIKGLHVQCFYGEDDGESLCARLKGTQYSIIRKPGDHHFDGDFASLTDAILQAQR